MNSYRTTDFQVRRNKRRTRMSVVQQVILNLPLTLGNYFNPEASILDFPKPP